MKKIFLLTTTLALSINMAFADGTNDETNALTTTEAQEIYIPGTDSPEPSGFLTGILNRSLETSIQPTSAEESPEFGRKVTKWASAPKFGGYAIGYYKYNSKEGANSGEGFGARLIRVYVDGSIFNDFKYRIQFEAQGGKPHIKDFFLSWSHWKELEVKVGQFKRCFTFENPYNPWDVGVGDYSQLTKKLAGFSDFCGGEATNNGGRDIGIQLQGDLFPVGSDNHRLVHYMAAVYNGQGINNTDANHQKDFIASLQFQPLKDWYIGFFGWTGNMTYGDKTIRRERYAIGTKYEHNGWSARAEYAHHSGSGLRADAWYATVGVPVTNWFKIYAKYDAYRPNAEWSAANTIYSIAPNFQLHKNLMFQLQYNYVNDRTKSNYHQLWAMTYFRF